jgi:regulatory protein
MTGSDETAPAEKLARVTYLPGVVPPSEPVVRGAKAETDNADPDNADPGDADGGDAHAAVAEPAAAEPDAATIERLRAMLSGTVPAGGTLKSIESEGSADTEGSAETAGERSARAHNVSMHALTRKGMSSAEMTTLLLSRDLDAHEVEIEITRLEQVGLLNDHDLASTLVRTLRDRKGLGRSAITAELRRRRIDGAAVEEALEAAYEVGGDDELTRAREIARFHALS